MKRSKPLLIASITSLIVLRLRPRQNDARQSEARRRGGGEEENDDVVELKKKKKLEISSIH